MKGRVSCAKYRKWLVFRRSWLVIGVQGIIASNQTSAVSNATHRAPNNVYEVSTTLLNSSRSCRGMGSEI